MATVIMSVRLDERLKRALTAIAETRDFGVSTNALIAEYLQGAADAELKELREKQAGLENALAESAAVMNKLIAKGAGSTVTVADFEEGEAGYEFVALREPDEDDGEYDDYDPDWYNTRTGKPTNLDEVMHHLNAIARTRDKVHAALEAIGSEVLPSDAELVDEDGRLKIEVSKKLRELCRALGINSGVLAKEFGFKEHSYGWQRVIDGEVPMSARTRNKLHWWLIRSEEEVADLEKNKPAKAEPPDNIVDIQSVSGDKGDTIH